MSETYLSGFRNINEASPEKEVTSGEALVSGFVLENDIVNFIDILTQPPKNIDPYFNPAEPIKKLGLEAFQEDLMTSVSQGDFDYRLAKLKREQQNRYNVARGGWSGFLGGIAGGVFSPTMFIPLIGPEVKAGDSAYKAMRSAALLSTAGGVLQEIPLQINQNDRTGWEGFQSVLGQAVLGGLLGSLVQKLGNAQIKKLSDGLAYAPGEGAIPKLGSEGGVIKPENTVTIDGMDFLDTRKTNVRFHGAKNELISPTSDYYNSANIYGQGFYTTDALDIAHGYSTRTQGGKVYQVEEIPQNVKVFNMEQKVPSWLQDKLINSGTDELIIAAEQDVKNVRELYDEIRNGATGSGMSRDEIQSLFDEVNYYLKEEGFNALSHKGGIKTGKAEHDVRIYLSPEEQIKIKEIKLTDYAAEKSVKTVDAIDAAKYEADLGFGNGSAGAKDVFDPKGGTYKTKLTAPVDAVNDRLLPTNRLVNQPGVEDKWEVARAASWAMDNGGVMGEINLEGRATAPGGTIKSRAQTHYGKLHLAHEGVTNAYLDYLYSGHVPFAGNLRASLGAPKRLGKMTRSEFMEQVGLALTDDTAATSVPQIRTAANAVRNELFNPMDKIADEVGVYANASKELKGDKSYFHRMYNLAKVDRFRLQLEQVLADHYHQTLMEDFTKAFEKEIGRQKAVDNTLADINMSGDAAMQIRQNMLDKLQAAEDARPREDLTIEENIRSVQRQIKDLRKKQRETTTYNDARPAEERMKSKPFENEIEQLKKDLENLKQAFSPYDAEFKALKKSTKSRLRALNKNAATLAARRADKINRVFDLEEAQLSSLERFSNKVARLKSEAGKLSDKVFLAKIKDAKNEFATQARLYDKNEERLVKLQETDELEKALNLESGQIARAGKMNKIADRLNDLESLDRQGWLQLIDDLQSEATRRTSQLHERRTLRQQKLFNEIKDLDPSVIKARIDALAGKNRARREKFMDMWREKKGLANPGGVFAGEAPEFMQHAKDLATKTVNKIANTTERLPYADILAGELGPEAARMLTISTDKIAFVLEMNVEKVMRAYMHQMAPDVEIARKFGDVRATHLFNQLQAEFERKLDALANAKGADGKPLAKTVIENKTEKISQEYREFKHILEAQLSRLRHTRDIPTNPRDFAYRAGMVIRNLNVLRYMGMTMLSSIPDIANIISHHGLTRTYRDIFVPMIQNFKEFRINSKQAYLWGEALDVYIHSRRDSLFDAVSELSPKSHFEKGIQYATDKMGIITMFDYWNQEIKKIASVASTAHLMDSMKTVMEGGTKADMDEALVYLARHNIEGEHVEKIWKQVVNQPGGGDKVKGLWWPNTQNWTDEEAKTLFAQAVSDRVSSVVVTPGLERPLITDANLAAKLIFQFKSFGFSSLSRSLQAGLQQGDMAALNGLLFSLALGAFSYYLSAVATGGQMLDEALKFDPAKYADEAIARSGRLAAYQTAWDVAQRLPFINQYSTFAGKNTTNTQGADLVELFAGPSFDFINRGANVIMGLDNPTQNTLHQARKMMLLQNWWLIRRALDQVEQSTGDALGLPERNN